MVMHVEYNDKKQRRRAEMKKHYRIISLIIAFSLLCGVCMFAASAIDDGSYDGYTPSIVIPGVFQCDVRVYNADGTEMMDSAGNKLERPFFLPATKDIVSVALKKCGFQLLKVLLTQQDKSGRFTTSVSETAADIFADKLGSDEKGELLNDIRAVEYNTNLAALSDYDRQFALDAIPLYDYMNIAGAENLYFFSYYSFDNIERLTARLYDLIQTAKRESGSDKVNLVPISQGGTIADYLLQYYPQVYGDIDRIIYIVPAVDGTNILGDIFTEGLLDDDEALYGYMWKRLAGDETGSIINLLIRLLPKSVLNDLLDKTADALMERLKYSTCLWALIPSSYYEKAANKYLDGPEDAYIREQTDKFHIAQVNYKQNILAAMDAGVKVFDITNYNVPLYCLGDTWDDVQADGVIQLDSTSMGATSGGTVDVTLPDGYVQQGNPYGTCSMLDSYNYIDPYRLVDASTGLLPDSTFYFHNGNHERTANNDVIISLATRLMTDENFTSVHSYPEIYPQFNEMRISRSTINSAKRWKNYDTSSLSEEDAAELRAAVAEIERLSQETVVDNVAWESAKTRFDNITDKISGNKKEEESPIRKIFMRDIVKAADIVERTVGYKGYSDIFRIK